MKKMLTDLAELLGKLRFDLVDKPAALKALEKTQVKDKKSK